MEKIQKFAIRKLSVGCVSCVIGIFMCGPAVYASDVDEPRETIVAVDNTVPDEVTDASTPVDVSDTVAVLNDYTYDSKAIQDKYGDGHIRFTDVSSKAIEIMKRDSKSFDDARKLAEIEVKKERGENLGFKNSYNNIYTNLKENVTDVVTNNIGRDVAEFDIKAKPLEFMIGLAYVNRLYNFKIDDTKTAKDVLIKNLNSFDQNAGQNTDLLIRIGSQPTDSLRFENAPALYERVISPFTGKRTLTEFIESLVPKNKDVNDWFKESSKAYIIDKKSKVNPVLQYKTYDKLKNETYLQKYILPLLTVSEESVYVISNSSTITMGLYDTYATKGQQEVFKTILENSADRQVEFIDFWLRNAEDKDKHLLASSRHVIDTMMKKPQLKANGQKQTALERWSPKNGANAAKGVKEFFTPLNQYFDYKFIGGQAEGTGMRMYITSALSDDGLSTYTHELTHLLDKDVWFAGHGRRDGLEVEFFARGLFESYELHDDPIYNLNLVYDKGDNRFTNKSPQRFQTEADLKSYMRGVMDVTYLLDGLEAEIILDKDDAIKQRWFNQHKQVVDTSIPGRTNKGKHAYTHMNDKFEPITLDTARHLRSVSDLVEYDIVASRYEFKGRQSIGEAKANDYYVIPLFTPDYATAENTNGVSGDVITRRLAHELLAEYGYRNGMVPYLSNKIKDNTGKSTDKVVFDHILGGKSIKQFKKDMFAERLGKEINPIGVNGQTISTKEELKSLMKEAIEKDLLIENKPYWSYGVLINSTQQPKLTNLERLKAAFFKAAINATNDFNTSIFKDKDEKRQLYVNDLNTASTNKGTRENPYKDLKLALEQAKDGDEIILLGSTILQQTNDALKLNKAVTIKSENGVQNMTLRGLDLVVSKDVTLKDVNLIMLRDGNSRNPIISVTDSILTLDGVTNKVSDAQSRELVDLRLTGSGNVTITPTSDVNLEKVMISGNTPQLTYTIPSVKNVIVTDLGQNTTLNLKEIDSLTYDNNDKNPTATIHVDGLRGSRRLLIGRDNTNTRLHLGTSDRSLTVSELVAPNVTLNTNKVYVNKSMIVNTVDSSVATLVTLPVMENALTVSDQKGDKVSFTFNDTPLKLEDVLDTVLYTGAFEIPLLTPGYAFEKIENNQFRVVEKKQTAPVDDTVDEPIDNGVDKPTDKPEDTPKEITHFVKHGRRYVADDQLPLNERQKVSDGEDGYTRPDGVVVAPIDEVYKVGTQPTTRIEYTEPKVTYKEDKSKEQSYEDRQEGQRGVQEVRIVYLVDEKTGDVTPQETVIRDEQVRDTVITKGTKPKRRTVELAYAIVREPASHLMHGTEHKTQDGVKGRDVFETTYHLDTTTGVVTENERLVEHVGAVSEKWLIGKKRISLGSGVFEEALPEKHVELGKPLVNEPLPDKHVELGKGIVEEALPEKHVDLGKPLVNEPLPEKHIDLGKGLIEETLPIAIVDKDGHVTEKHVELGSGVIEEPLPEKHVELGKPLINEPLPEKHVELGKPLVNEPLPEKQILLNNTSSDETTPHKGDETTNMSIKNSLEESNSQNENNNQIPMNHHSKQETMVRYYNKQSGKKMLPNTGDVSNLALIALGIALFCPTIFSRRKK